MQIGDLVKFKVPDFAKGQLQENGRLAGENRPVGLITGIRHVQKPIDSLRVVTDTHYQVLWTEPTGVRETYEFCNDLEVVNEAG